MIEQCAKGTIKTTHLPDLLEDPCMISKVVLTIEMHSILTIAMSQNSEAAKDFCEIGVLKKSRTLSLLGRNSCTGGFLWPEKLLRMLFSRTTPDGCLKQQLSHYFWKATFSLKETFNFFKQTIFFLNK